MRPNRLILLPIILLLALPPQAQAGLSEALQAYASGDYETASKEATQAANQGVREANRLLGEMRQTGRGLPQNDALAWAHYSKAAMSGDGESQYRLGQMYEQGQGVPQSFAEAAKWYQRASQEGHSGAKARLGKLTLAGRGGKVSFNKGLALIEEAALSGDPEAETMLADLERKGLASTRKLLEQAPMDAESAGILVEVRAMVQAFGAPPPLGPGLKLGGAPLLARRDGSSWTFILPKPEASASQDGVWQAASIRLTLNKTAQGALDAKIQLPSIWRNLTVSGRELGQMEIGSQSVLGLWSPDRHQWLRHNAQFGAIRLSSPDGQGSVDQVASYLETQPSGDGRTVNAIQTLRLAKGQFSSPKQGGFAFAGIDVRTSLQGLDGNASAKEEATVLKGFENRIGASGLTLSGIQGVVHDTEIASLEMSFGAEDLDQAASRFRTEFNANGIAAKAATGGTAILPGSSLPERITIKLSAERLPLKDLSNQIAALVMNRAAKSAHSGQVISDAAFDAMATTMDALADANAEFKIDELSAKAPGWGISATGLFTPLRGHALPFTGKLSVASQGIDDLIRTLDEGSSFIAVLLDGLKRTTPPKKDPMGNDLFEVTFAPDGAIDINGQRWSQPDTPAKAKPGKPSSSRKTK